MPSVTAGLKWPPEIGPTAKAIAITERPTANATAISPADGAENSAAPQTPVTSANVPTNSAPSSRADDAMDPPAILLPGEARARITWFTRKADGATGFSPPPVRNQ